MSKHVAEDIAIYLSETMGFQRMKEVFTDAEQGAYTNRPLAIVVREGRNPKKPEITEEVDYISVVVSVSASYNQTGEKSASYKAMDIYNKMRVLLDITINGTDYLSITASTPPVHVGYDSNERTVYEINYDIIRYLGGIEDGD